MPASKLIDQRWRFENGGDMQHPELSAQSVDTTTNGTVAEKGKGWK